MPFLAVLIETGMDMAWHEWAKVTFEPVDDFGEDVQDALKVSTVLQGLLLQAISKSAAVMAPA